MGVTLPQFGGQAEQAVHVGRFAREAEGLGAAGLWVADRLLVPTDPAIGYAGAADHPDNFRKALDPLVLLAAAAATTSTVRLGTNVLNAVWHPPVLLARTVTSIDRVSGGRLLLGMGVGWSPEEFAAVGVPMAERGDRLDECLDVLDAWWHGDPVAHSGRVATVAPSRIDLKPHGIPVYLGAYSPRGLRRIAERGTGWMPTTLAGLPLDKITAMWDGLDRVPMILRVNVPAGTPLDAVSTTLEAAAALGVEEAFVELAHIADDVDDALALTRELLSRHAPRTTGGYR